MSSVSEHRSAGCGRANIISNSFRVVQRTSVVGACERDEDDMSFHEVCACYVLVLQFNDLLIDCISCRCTERRIWTRPSRSWCSAWATRDRRQRRVPRFDGVVAIESCGSTGRCPTRRRASDRCSWRRRSRCRRRWRRGWLWTHVCLKIVCYACLDLVNEEIQQWWYDLYLIHKLYSITWTICSVETCSGDEAPAP